VIHLADKLAYDIPRNLDVAMFHHAVHQLAAALAKPPTGDAPISPPPRKQSCGRHVRAKCHALCCRLNSMLWERCLAMAFIL
jgi:hypothetical protein